MKLGRWNVRESQVAVGLLAMHAVLAWLNRAFVGGLWHDEAQYLLLSRALRRLSYNDFWLVGAPFDSQYPPGLPAFFAALSLPFGEHVQLLLLVIVACSVVGLWLLYDIIRRCDAPATALVVLALAALNPEIILYAGRPLSEQPYMMFSLLALWAVVRESTTPATTAPGSRAPVLAMASATYAALIRLAGATVIGAVMLQWALERRIRRVVTLTAAGAVTVGAFMLWLILVAPHTARRSYIADATFSPRTDFGVLAVIRHRITTNVGDYVTTTLPRLLQLPSAATVARHSGASAPAVSAWGHFDAFIGFVVVLGLGAFGMWMLWKRARVVPIYLVLYFGLLAVWSWHQSRYLVPVLPPLLWALFVAVEHVAGTRRTLRYLPALFAGGILLMSVGRNASALRESLRCDRRKAEAASSCFSPIEQGFFSAMRFVRDDTPDSAAFLTSADTQLGYFGGRRALFSAPLTGLGADSLLATLRSRGVEYVLLTPLRPPEDQLVPALETACRSLQVVREFAAVTLVLRLQPRNLEPTSDACAAMHRYVAAGWKSNLW